MEIMGSMRWLSTKAGVTSAARLSLCPADAARLQQRGGLGDSHALDAHALTREPFEPVWARGDDRCDLDDRVRARRRHAGEAPKLRDCHEPIRYVFVEKAMVDGGRRLDPAVRLAVVKNVVG